MEDGAPGGTGGDATKDAGIPVPDRYAGGVADGIPRGFQEERRAMRVLRGDEGWDMLGSAVIDDIE